MVTCTRNLKSDVKHTLTELEKTTLRRHRSLPSNGWQPSQKGTVSNTSGETPGLEDQWFRLRGNPNTDRTTWGCKLYQDAMYTNHLVFGAARLGSIVDKTGTTFGYAGRASTRTGTKSIVGLDRVTGETFNHFALGLSGTGNGCYQ